MSDSVDPMESGDLTAEELSDLPMPSIGPADLGWSWPQMRAILADVQVNCQSNCNTYYSRLTTIHVKLASMVRVHS